VKLAEHNRVKLVQVSGHIRIDGNEMADELARQHSSHLLTGHQTAFGTSTKGWQGSDYGLDKQQI